MYKRFKAQFIEDNAISTGSINYMCTLISSSILLFCHGATKRDMPTLFTTYFV